MIAENFAVAFLIWSVIFGFVGVLLGAVSIRGRLLIFFKLTKATPLDQEVFLGRLQRWISCIAAGFAALSAGAYFLVLTGLSIRTVVGAGISLAFMGGLFAVTAMIVLIIGYPARTRTLKNQAEEPLQELPAEG